MCDDVWMRRGSGEGRSGEIIMGRYDGIRKVNARMMRIRNKIKRR